MTLEVFQQMDADVFEVMGEDATVQRGTDAPALVRVVIERGVKVLGKGGEVVQRVDMVSFRNLQWKPEPGDVVTQGATSRKIDTIDNDDSYVSRAVLYG